MSAVFYGLRYSSCAVGKVLDVFRPHRPFENTVLSVGEPFLENLVAAQPVGPDGSRDVAPEGAIVQMDIKRRFSQLGHCGSQYSEFRRRKGTFDNAAP